jgi:hypothetical protein
MDKLKDSNLALMAGRAHFRDCVKALKACNMLRSEGFMSEAQEQLEIAERGLIELKDCFIYAPALKQSVDVIQWGVNTLQDKESKNA